MQLRTDVKLVRFYSQFTNYPTLRFIPQGRLAIKFPSAWLT